MKRLLVSALSVAICLSASAQMSDAQKAATEAAKTISAAQEVTPEIQKPKYWNTSLKTQVNVGQTQLTNWAAGGDNTVSLAAFIDGNANWKKGEMFWNNRLQLDYGFLYASSKPIVQKSTDRIYLESKWGYKAPSTKYLYFSANYDFKSQFSTGYDYKTPAMPTEDAHGNPIPEGTKLDQLEHSHQISLWKDARVLKSNFLAPAYTNLALGIDFVPTKWLSVNFAPLTGGFVIVKDDALRANYGMPLKKKYENLTEGIPEDGSQLRSARFEFGAQLKVDAKVNINDNFSYSTQVVLFSNYLDKPLNLRVNWDNRLDWKLAKYFSFTITTNLIYDDKIMIPSESCKKHGHVADSHQRIQFKESLAFGFTYTIASKK